MGNPGHAASIFSQKLDRVALTAYFLGAIAPLVALTFVVERYVLPAMPETAAAIGLMALVGSLAVLSLGSFVILRRSTRQSLRRMDRDNLRLQSLLKASSSLASAEDEALVAATSARCAASLTSAGGAYVMMQGEPGKPLNLVQSAGKEADSLYESQGKVVRELANLAVKQGRPAIRGGGAKGGGEGATAAAVPIPGDTAPLGVLVAIHAKGSERMESACVASLSTLAALASVALRNAELRDAQRNFFSHVTDMLVTALDAHLGYHSGHSKRVALIANRIGREMGLDETCMQRLHFASLLHDIGMLKIDRALQKSPKTCQKHAVLGFRMLNRIRLWQEIAPIVHHHHEWFDGRGYPEGLAGEAIPLESRIIGFCEALDSMFSDASYKMALSWEDTLGEIQSATGTQFDPQVTGAFHRLVERGALDAATLKQ